MQFQSVWDSRVLKWLLLHLDGEIKLTQAEPPQQETVCTFDHPESMYPKQA
jgi:hypothetical protein